MSLKSYQCHIVIRLERLMPQFEHTIRLLSYRSHLGEHQVLALDADFPGVFGPAFKDKVDACLTTGGLRAMYAAGDFSNSMVGTAARKFLCAQPQ